MKIKLYAVPFITFSFFLQAMDDHPQKPVKSLTANGKPIEKNQKPDAPADYPAKPPATQIKEYTDTFESFIKRLEPIRSKVDPLIQQQVKTAVQKDIAELTKQDNYLKSNQNTLAYNIELIDYLIRKNRNPGLLKEDNIRELIPLLEQINPNSNSEELRQKTWKKTSNLIVFSTSLNEIRIKKQQDLFDQKHKDLADYVRKTLEQAEQEKIAKENSFFVRLKRLAQRTYSNFSDWLSPITNMQYSLMLRTLIVPLAYFLSEKQ